MGKGGTKFESEAIGVRNRGDTAFPSAKEMRREMEIFKRTGRHPALEGSTVLDVIPLLPDHDPNRPHVFLDLRVGKRALGRLVIEVFEPEIPLAAKQFMNRCHAGASDTFKGTTIHRLVENLGMFGGHHKGHKGVQYRKNSGLRHSVKGTVSISATVDEFCIAFTRALTLDESHQVVGRVHLGEETLDELNRAEVSDNDVPLQRITVADCGPTNAQGVHDPFGKLAGKKESPEETAARLKAESAAARSAVMEGLEAGLQASKKRKEAPALDIRLAAKKKTMMDDVLELSDNGSGSEESD